MIVNLIHNTSRENGAVTGSNQTVAEGRSQSVPGGNFQSILKSLEFSLGEKQSKESESTNVSDKSLRAGLGGLVSEDSTRGETGKRQESTAAQSEAASGEVSKESSNQTTEGERDKKATRQAGSGRRELPSGEALLNQKEAFVSENESVAAAAPGRDPVTEGERGVPSEGADMGKNESQIPLLNEELKAGVISSEKSESESGQITRLSTVKNASPENLNDPGDSDPGIETIYTEVAKMDLATGSEDETVGERGEKQTRNAGFEDNRPLTGGSLLNQILSDSGNKTEIFKHSDGTQGSSAPISGSGRPETDSIAADGLDRPPAVHASGFLYEATVQKEPVTSSLKQTAHHVVREEMESPVKIKSETLSRGRSGALSQAAAPLHQESSSSPALSEALRQEGGVNPNPMSDVSPREGADPLVQKGDVTPVTIAEKAGTEQAQSGKVSGQVLSDQKEAVVSEKPAETENREIVRNPVSNPIRSAEPLFVKQAAVAAAQTMSSDVPLSRREQAEVPVTPASASAQAVSTPQVAASAFVPHETSVKKERMDLSSFERGSSRATGFATEASGTAARGINRMGGGTGQSVQDLSAASGSVDEPTEDELLWTEHTAEDAEQSENRSSDLQSIAFSRLTDLHVTNLYVRRTVLPGITQAVLSTTSEGKSTENWQRHNFVLEDGSKISLSARESEGVLHIKLAASLGELNKILQQYQNEIREHLEKECNLTIDLQFEGHNPESENGSFLNENMIGGRFAPARGRDETEEGNQQKDPPGYSARIRSFGYNQNEWTA
ncbi:MAG: hypothetical protein EA360_06550 [Balneolaceae bacterium]|nr:MAG: hypothetical protein EA360_06550 [Balneolaceae bacterium]